MDRNLAYHLSRRRDDAVRALRQTAVTLRNEVQLADWSGWADDSWLECINSALKELMPNLYTVAPQLVESLRATALARIPLHGEAEVSSALGIIADAVAYDLGNVPVQRLKASIRCRIPRARHKGIALIEEGARWFHLNTRELIWALQQMRGASPTLPWPGPRPPEEIQYPDG